MERNVRRRGERGRRITQEAPENEFTPIHLEPCRARPAPEEYNGSTPFQKGRGKRWGEEKTFVTKGAKISFTLIYKVFPLTLNNN